jgi:phosphopantothenoylcysteine decarboxylase/phosphopantothenate--cysteine ligase
LRGAPERGSGGGRSGAAPGTFLGILAGKRILLVVTGGIAAYKAACLARLLAKNGAEVKTVLTEAGARFVTPLTFEAATGGEAAVSMWDRAQTEIGHVAWAKWAELAVVAPATADFCARLAAGRADDLASAVALAFSGPKIVCPAMNAGMYLNPATAANLALLASRGLTVMESPHGLLACGDEGPGRLPEPADIAAEAARALAPKLLSGKRVLVTSGATVEPWDDIRYLTNRSSGKTGAEIARAAWLMGARVELVSGPHAAGAGLESRDLLQTRIGSCAELLEAVRAKIPQADALVMNAAPADFRPKRQAPGKIRKSAGVPELELEFAPDILKSVSGLKPSGATWVGFAAEPERDLARALGKLREKSLDFIAVNRAGGPDSAFAGDFTSVTVLDGAGGRVLETGPCAKFAAAWMLLEAVFGRPCAGRESLPAEEAADSPGKKGP